MTGRRTPLLILFATLAACTVSEPAPTPTTTTTRAPGPVPIVLSARGLLPHEVGGPMAPVVTALSELVGGPDRETAWLDASSSVFGDCPGFEVRGFGWGSLYLVEQRAEDGDTFFTWTYGFDHELAESGDPRGLGLRTADGIGLGSTRSDLEAVLGPRLTLIDDGTTGITTFLIDGAQPEHLRGRLSGSGDGAVVDYLERVPGCG
jgi:hypothetical protein